MAIDREKYRQTTVLHYFKQLFNEEYKSFSDYINDSLDLLDNAKNELHREIKAGASKAPKEEYEEALNAAYDWHEDDFYKLEHINKRFLTHSAFVASVSLFEHFLERLTFNQRKSKGSSNIDNYRLTLINSLGLNMKSQEKLWKQIEDYYFIRNDVVHNNSAIQKKSVVKAARSTKILKKLKYIEFNDKSGKFKITDRKFIL